MTKLEKKILAALEEIRPFLIQDGGDISLETFVIYDIIFSFSEKFDEKLLDPVWETVSMKIRKYKPFLNINVFNFKKILREIVNE